MSILHIRRIMGFSFMVLVLWSPVVIPLLPTLVQTWTISSSTGIVGYACIVGLYFSITILVMLWGKRIRGYENPVEQYGMNIGSPSRAREFFLGLVGGVTIVGLVHSISILLGLNGRSLPSIPGFLLLSLVLFGLKQRTQGKLAAPIGLRSGIMTASYLIQNSGFITFKPGTPFWLVSTYHLHPFDGAIGLSICSLLAILFFPQKPAQKDASV
ncbi:hypothetical protein PR202_ga15753 [Eleusine coracana subsp. coracana]|uniref:Uncharacterized protein n=1 Tax=Eleusine coracana subsp. coracana TaxID=191504 RepID=A0AAV5CL99_ELECO|nr:hypothetical protein PR202_ga15753 [Eleusine coracana subsp. coracana]